MRTYAASGKITESHLNRRAIVYLRQSSLKQVQQNKESQRLQYALAETARAWGWNEVEVIDTDLGSSASLGAAIREGFEKVIGRVAMGEAGIIFNREASRLSRTDKDWCRLLEVCGVFATLISDGEQVYDLNDSDDQLILGVKGTLSVYELRILRKRLVEGMQEKAARGEYKRQLPPGYLWDEAGKIVKDPDQRVQEAVRLVFAKFREIRSIRQTFLWFHSEKIELPVIKDRGGLKHLVWQLPRSGTLTRMLQNPVYAGVYVWGRQTTGLNYVDGRIVKRTVRKPTAREAKVFLEGSHEGYIGVDTFEEIQRIIRSNLLIDRAGVRVGAARGGQGLLGGLLRCGRCGRKLYVVYSGASGTAARYLCRGDYNAGGSYCLAFGGSTVDRRFARELLSVISPYGVQAAVEAIRATSSEQKAERRLIEQKVAQLEYEATRAFEQYNCVDPRNRLVAMELESRWNEKLEQLERAKGELDSCDRNRPDTLNDEQRSKLRALGERFPEVWESERCSMALKKKIVRSVVEEVIVNLEDRSQTLRFIIHWKGGCHTELQMPKPPSGVGLKTSEENLEIIRKMAVRYGDRDIARVLNKLGRQTATGKRWSALRVETIRGKYSIAGHTYTVKDPEILTLGQAAKYLGVSQTTIKRLVANGILEKRQLAPWAPWEIRRSELDSQRIGELVQTLRKTGKLRIEGVDPKSQRQLFSDPESQQRSENDRNVISCEEMNYFDYDRKASDH
jgi:DNA invertase Pin-like site-specific DNA recombinase